MRFAIFSAIAFSAIALSASSASADSLTIPSLNGVAGCILKEYTKLGTDGWDVYVDWDYSGRQGAGTRINACEQSRAGNINYGKYVTAAEVNSVFTLLQSYLNSNVVKDIKLNISDTSQTSSPAKKEDMKTINLTYAGKRLSNDELTKKNLSFNKSIDLVDFKKVWE